MNKSLLHIIHIQSIYKCRLYILDPDLIFSVSIGTRESQYYLLTFSSGVELAAIRKEFSNKKEFSGD